MKMSTESVVAWAMARAAEMGLKAPDGRKPVSFGPVPQDGSRQWLSSGTHSLRNAADCPPTFEDHVLRPLIEHGLIGAETFCGWRFLLLPKERKIELTIGERDAKVLYSLIGDLYCDAERNDRLSSLLEALQKSLESVGLEDSPPALGFYADLHYEPGLPLILPEPSETKPTATVKE